MTDVNVELLEKTLKWVEDEAAKPWTKREWNQQAWVDDPADVIPDKQDIALEPELEWSDVDKDPLCGTCYCYAGRIAADDGYTVYGERGGQAKNPETGDYVDIEEYAALKLRISFREASRLFDPDNSVDRIRQIVHDIIDSPETS